MTVADETPTARITDVPSQTAGADPGGDHGTDQALPDLVADDWMHHSEAFSRTGFWAVARRLPTIVRDAIGLGWRASRRDTVVALGLNLLAGVMTTLGLLATSTVLQQLFAAGPTPHRIRAAVPALAAAGLAIAMRGGLGVAAGWSQARLAPYINVEVEVRLFEATTAVELAAFDDAGFAEEMDRARDRGMSEAASIVDATVDLTTGLVAVVATITAVVVIAPLLAPCVLLASIPTAVTAIRIARRQYLAMLARITRRRRMWMLAAVMANRYTAAEVRSYQMRDVLLAEYRHIMALETASELRLVRAQSSTRLLGTALDGIGSLGVYVLLAALLLGGEVPLAAAATALIALQAAGGGLSTAIHATNTLYESTLYYGDYRAFIGRAGERTPASGGTPVDGFDEITAERVSLAYPDGKRDAVHEVSLSIRRGEVIALVGENGSGKSSLGRSSSPVSINRLAAPSAGTASRCRASTRSTVAAQVAVISQDWWRFPFTAGAQHRDRAHPTARPMRVTCTPRRGPATAHEMIEDLPHGYETLLSREFRDGHDLSGGQWQRLVAARGFYRDAMLLICDEPSAALDARAEYAMFQQLRRRPERTVHADADRHGCRTIVGWLIQLTAELRPIVRVATPTPGGWGPAAAVIDDHDADEPRYVARAVTCRR